MRTPKLMCDIDSKYLSPTLAMWAFLTLAEFGESACARTLSTIVLTMGGRGGRLPASGGGEKLIQLMERWGHWGCDG
jgi:hypothetical protein